MLGMKPPVATQQGPVATQQGPEQGLLCLRVCFLLFFLLIFLAMLIKIYNNYLSCLRKNI